jgi:hypothetical protein
MIRMTKKVSMITYRIKEEKEEVNQLKFYKKKTWKKKRRTSIL